MKPFPRRNTLFVMLFSLLLVANLQAAGSEEQQATTPPATATATATATEQEQSAKQPQAPAELEALRRQYHKKDPTGVRARLGMCRHGHRGQGKMGRGRGNGRGWREGMPPGPHHRWQQGAEEWNSPQ